ncbi:hypothetical protein ACWCQ0_18430 [Streptomyces massasporeus]|uniref:Uncharacterized protein n=1 Tax=Streptomyces massasporeus TaxID=67324 RepID=A0ABW6LBR3_9ACTN
MTTTRKITWDAASARRAGRPFQVERVGEVLEAAPELVVGEVTVGPHA